VEDEVRHGVSEVRDERDLHESRVRPHAICPPPSVRASPSPP
jgi:hypothetical protein